MTYFGTGCLISSRIVLTCAHNIYDRTDKVKGTDLKFIPVVRDKAASRIVGVHKAYYPTQYQEKENQESSCFDFGVLELEHDLEEEYGYLGIDTRK